MRLAIVASESLQLEALLNAFQELPEPPELELVAVGHDSQSALYGNRTLAFTGLEDFNFSAVDVALLLAESVAAEASLAQLQAADCSVVAWVADADVLKPLIDAGRDVALVDTPVVFALKTAYAQMLNETGEIERLQLNALMPASLFGAAGVSELASQTAKLLNGQSIDEGVFSSQVTFNYFPLASTNFGATYLDQLKLELAECFDQAQLHVNALQLPVFHGLGLMLDVEVAQECELEALRAAFTETEGFELHDSLGDLSGLSFAKAQQDILVGDLFVHEEDKHSLRMFLGFDEAQFGIGKNWVLAGQKLQKSYS